MSNHYKGMKHALCNCITMLLYYSWTW